MTRLLRGTHLFRQLIAQIIVEENLVINMILSLLPLAIAPHTLAEDLVAPATEHVDDVQLHSVNQVDAELATEK